MIFGRGDPFKRETFLLKKAFLRKRGYLPLASQERFTGLPSFTTMSAEVRASIIDGGTASFWRKENAAKLVVWKLMKLIIAFGWRKFVVRMNYGKVKETALKMGLLAKEEVGEKKSSTT